jgi:hypothetical protein
MVTPIDQDYTMVDPESRIPGEGSPRHSGEEADPFLQRNGAATAQQRDAEAGVRTSQAEPGSLSSNGSSSNRSGYGVLIDRPTLNLMPATTEELNDMRSGHILSPEELHRINEETVLPADNGDRRNAPLPPPPRLVDPSTSTLPLARPPFKPQTSHLSQMSTIPDAADPVTVAMARRVRIEDLSSRSSPQLPLPLADTGASSTTGFLAGLGAGLASIGRLSWLKSGESNSSRRSSRMHSYLTAPHDDIEAGKSLLQPQMAESSSQWRSFERKHGGTRISTSTVGDGSVYHDAYSSLPGTPVTETAKLSPLPRALTPSGPTAETNREWLSKSALNTDQTPLHDPVESSTVAPTTSASVFNHGLPTGQDILDVPAPSAVLPFMTAAASTSTLSLREKNTTSSLALKTHPFPPGLALGVQKKLWTDASSSMTEVAPFAVVESHLTRPDISIDILEEAPPAAEEGWRSMSAIIQDGPGRRTTFGTVSVLLFQI